LDASTGSSTEQHGHGPNRPGPRSLPNASDGLTRTLAVPAHASNFGGQSVTTRLGLNTVLSARAFNQIVVAYSNDHRMRKPLSTAPELFINGFGILGGDSAGPHRYTSQQWQVIDNVMLTRGRNELTFGGASLPRPPRGCANSTSMLASTTPRSLTISTIMCIVSSRPS
jgi:hypothetical protein